jgi:lysophospholipase L1-like esterase
MRTIVGRLILIVLGGFFGLVCLEIGIRGLHLEKDTFWEPHPLYGYFHIPNREGWWFSPEIQVKVKINSKGLRNREIGHEKPAGVTRILILGDSMTEGIQVPMEETFSALLEARLNQSGSAKFEVVNAGVSHFGTDNEVLYFQNEGYKYQPDIVILAFLTTNDVMDNSFELSRTSPYYVLGDGSRLGLKNFPLQLDESPFNRLRLFLGTNVQSYNFFSRSIRTQAPRIAQILQSFGVMHQGTTQGIPTDFFVYAPQYDAKWDEAWEITRRLIMQLKQDVEAQRARFLVVVFSPQFVHVREQNWQDYLNAIPAMKERAWDVDKPDRLITDFLKAEQIPYLQTINHFQAEAKRTSQLLYFPADGHLNQAGHRLAAQLIWEQINRLNLLLP